MMTTTESKKYEVLLIDPPWSFKVWNKDTGSGRSAEAHYRTMSLKDICDLPVKEVCAPNCALFLWSVWPSIFDARDVIEAWGFKYKTLGFEWWKLNKGWVNIYKNLPLMLISESALEKLFFFGMGYYCLGSKVQVYVCHKDTGKVSHLTLEELYQIPIESFLIHTPSGWKEIKGMWKQPIRETLCVNHRLGKTICTPNHRWAIKTLYKPRLGKKRLNLHKITFETVERMNKLRSSAIYKNNGLNLLFSERPVESFKPLTKFEEFKLDYDTGWLIGLYCAEGYIQKTRIAFYLHINEIALAKRIELTINKWNLNQDRYFNYKVKVCHYEAPEQTGRSCCFSSKRVVSLIKQFVIGSRANEKKLNKDILLQTSAEFRQGFIDGFLAGDGTKNKPTLYGRGYRGYISVGSSSEQLIYDLSWLFRTLGVMTTINKPYYRSSKSYPDRFTWAYGLTFCYPRNSGLVFNGQSVLPVRFDGTEQESIQETYDLSVDGEVFVADDLISHNTRTNSEPCLLATRGSMPVAVHNERNFIIAPVRKHSQKPDEQYDKIEKLYPNKNYLELFARQTRPNWTSLGYDIDGKDIRDALEELT